MSASLAPECNNIKEWVQNQADDILSFHIFHDDQILRFSLYIRSLKNTLGATTLAFSNGTAKVIASPHFQLLVASVWQPPEYLRGIAKDDECEPLFKEYKQCIGVSSGTVTDDTISDIDTERTDLAQAALKDRGIDKMLDEVRADNEENDLENMRS